MLSHSSKLDAACLADMCLQVLEECYQPPTGSRSGPDTLCTCAWKEWNYVHCPVLCQAVVAPSPTTCALLLLRDLRIQMDRNGSQTPYQSTERHLKQLKRVVPYGSEQERLLDVVEHWNRVLHRINVDDTCMVFNRTVRSSSSTHSAPKPDKMVLVDTSPLFSDARAIGLQVSTFDSSIE